MLNNFIKVAFRNITKRKGYSIINIAGLSLGIAAFLLIMIYVQGELSYDRFHQKADRIYRIGLKFHMGSQNLDMAQCPLPMADVLSRECSEVETAVRLVSAGERYIEYEGEQFAVERFFWADASIFDVFDMTLVKGDEGSALSEPNSVVITTAVAKRFFGDEDPVGKLLTVNDTTLLTVTAVREEFPANSHVHLDFIGSLYSSGKPGGKLAVPGRLLYLRRSFREYSAGAARSQAARAGADSCRSGTDRNNRFQLRRISGGR